MPNTEPAGIHDTKTCDAGPGGGPCDLCAWAESTKPRESVDLRNLKSIIHHAEIVEGQARGLKCCERCEESDRQEGAQQEQQRQTFSAPLIRLALADVIDSGDPFHDMVTPWLFYADESDLQTAERVRFIDAVVERLRELRASKG